MYFIKLIQIPRLSLRPKSSGSAKKKKKKKNWRRSRYFHSPIYSYHGFQYGQRRVQGAKADLLLNYLELDFTIVVYLLFQGLILIFGQGQNMDPRCKGNFSLEIVWNSHLPAWTHTHTQCTFAWFLSIEISVNSKSSVRGEARVYSSWARFKFEFEPGFNF